MVSLIEGLSHLTSFKCESVKHTSVHPLIELTYPCVRRTLSNTLQKDYYALQTA